MRSTAIRCMLLCLSLGAAAVSAAPQYISYQGYLVDDAGNPVNSTTNITFLIYADAHGGVAEWQETHEDVVVINGLFNVSLGRVVDFGTLFDGGTKYLACKMDDGVESDPRIPLISVPYALHAQQADTAGYALAGPGSGEGGWADDGDVVRLTSTDDSVGIGTTAPACKLDVVSDATSIRGASTGGDGQAAVFGFNTDEGAGVYGFSSFGQGVYGTSPYGFAGYFDGPVSYFSSRVGIAVESPLASLDIAQSSEEVCLHFSNGTRDITWRPTHALQIGQWDGTTWTERMRIAASGNVGIGTPSPGHLLDVGGDVRAQGDLNVEGDLDVTGAFKGSISSTTGSTGAPFPRPAFDTTVAGDPCINQEILHDIGGNPRDYVVDLQFIDSEYMGLNAKRLGGDLHNIDVGMRSYGAYWYQLNNSSITVRVECSEENIDSVRVRIWVTQ